MPSRREGSFLEMPSTTWMMDAAKRSRSGWSIARLRSWNYSREGVLPWRGILMVKTMRWA